MSVNDLLNNAIEETKHLKADEVFLVKELFKGYEWNRIAIKDRLRLGVLFLTKVCSDDGMRIMMLNKTSSNQQQYLKQ